MKAKLFLFMIMVYIVFFFPLILAAQQDTIATKIIRLELKGGSVLVGKIIEENESVLKIRTLDNIESTVPKDQIKKREIISGEMIKGEFWRKDPNQTRLFFAPTGRSLKAGHGYFSVYEIFFPFLAIGITDFFILAGGITLFPGAENQLVYLAPKITPIQQEKFDLSGGVLYIKIPDEEDAAGIVYGVTTYGTEQSAFTFGLGFGFAGGEFADKPVIVLGGEIRGSRSVKFISENWFVPGEEGQLLSLGIRFFGENLAADFAFILPTGDGDGFPLFPWVGFAYNFGRDK